MEMKKYFMLALFATVVHGISIAQTNEELTVLKTCLTQHDYNSKRKEFLTSVGEKVNIKQIDLTTLNSIFTALIWTSVGDDSDYNSSATHDITLYTLRKKNEQYEVLSETTVSVGAPITEVTVATEIISLTGTEALTVRFGRDVDIEGGEIKLNLLSVSPNGSKLILEHVVRINSGEDCESEDLESEVYIM